MNICILSKSQTTYKNTYSGDLTKIMSYNKWKRDVSIN